MGRFGIGHLCRLGRVLVARKKSSRAPALATRIARTRAFLALFKPALAADLVPLTDVAGPTGWDPPVQALVVSRETLAGAAASTSSRPPHTSPRAPLG